MKQQLAAVLLSFSLMLPTVALAKTFYSDFPGNWYILGYDNVCQATTTESGITVNLVVNQYLGLKTLNVSLSKRSWNVPDKGIISIDLKTKTAILQYTKVGKHSISLSNFQSLIQDLKDYNSITGILDFGDKVTINFNQSAFDSFTSCVDKL